MKLEIIDGRIWSSHMENYFCPLKSCRQIKHAMDIRKLYTQIK
jgi:hypothetical protein